MLESPVHEESAPFFDVLYRLEIVKSGFHHPDGMLWVRRPDRRHRVHEGKIPLRAVAPMILDSFGVQMPEQTR